jgi:catechol 2,3-dioxygenase
VERVGVGPAPEHTAGLRHWTVELPEPREIEDVRGRLEAAGVPVTPDGEGFVVRDPWQTAVRVVGASR